MLAQQRSHAGPEAFDWGKVSTKPYIRVVKRLIPEVDTDLDALDDEEQMSASKERRNLTDVFLEKRRGVSSLKLRTLLKVSVLNTIKVHSQAAFRGVKMVELFGKKQPPLDLSVVLSRALSLSRATFLEHKEPVSMCD